MVRSALMRAAFLLLAGTITHGAFSLDVFFDHVFTCFEIDVPFFAVTPVFICNLPLFLRCILTFFKTRQLLFFVKNEEELDDDSPFKRQALLEIIDFFVCTLPFFRRGESFYTLDEYATVPAAVKDFDMTGSRNLCSETP